MTARYWAVIPAAGSGLRMGSSIPKQYLSLGGRTVIEHVLGLFLADPRIAGITVAVAADDPYWQRYLPQAAPKPVRATTGGEQRAHSVLNALKTLGDDLEDDDWVLVHDAVRPCLHRHDLDMLVRELSNDPVGGILGTPLADTVKRVDADRRIVETPSRADLWRAFTPQMFRYRMLREALESCIREGFVPSDEATAMEHRRHEVQLLEGRSDNIKITRPDDIALAENILRLRDGVP